MDRAATLDRLDTIIAPGGTIALFYDDHSRTAENRWFDILNEVLNRYGHASERVVRQRRSPDHRSHESYLLASSFSVLEGVSVVVRRPITVDEIVGRALSLSACSPEKLGSRRGDFEADLRNALSLSAAMIEIASMVALIAQRPNESEQRDVCNRPSP